MKTRVFMSNPKPCNARQTAFVEQVLEYFESRDIEPHTLGRSDYDMAAPLEAIRRIMLESNGILVIAFRRYLVESGSVYYLKEDGREDSSSVGGEWFTSPWCHIEAGMAFQLGLPLLIFRESGVRDDGILQRGAVGTYLPEFNLTDPNAGFFQSDEWRQLIGQFESECRNCCKEKGQPKRWYR